MKVFPICIFMLLSAVYGRAQAPLKFDYTLIFGNLYRGEAISLQINNKQVFKKFQLNNQDTALKGNLNLVQATDILRINFNGTEIKRNAVSYDHHLNLKLVVDKKIEKLEVDLRKGNIIILNWVDGALAIQQIQEPVLLDITGIQRK